MNSLSNRCSECAALYLLNKYDIVSNAAKIADKPDIQDEDKSIEVVTIAQDKEISQSLFGGRRKNFIDVTDYECKTCKYYNLCTEENSIDFCKCKRFKKQPVKWVIEGNVCAPIATLWFNPNYNHPAVVLVLQDVTTSSEDINDTIQVKERKAINYKQGKPLELFILCDHEPNSWRNIRPSIFKNIYMYCIANGTFYKNGELIDREPLIDNYCMLENCKERTIT